MKTVTILTLMLQEKEDVKEALQYIQTTLKYSTQEIIIYVKILFNKSTYI